MQISKVWGKLRIKKKKKAAATKQIGFPHSGERGKLRIQKSDQH